MRKWFCGLFMALCTVPLCAATFFGKVESIDSGARKVVVQGSKTAGKKTFTIPDKASITLNGRKSAIDVIMEGAEISVSTDDEDNVTRVNVRPGKGTPPATTSAAEKVTANDTPAKPKKSSSAKPKDRDVAKDLEQDAARSGAVGSVSPEDWPAYGGTAYDNVSRATGLLKAWPAEGPEEAWVAKGFGEGYASVTVAGGLVYSMGNVGANEAVTAVDLETGKPAWQRKTGAASRLDAGNGPRGTPTYDEGRVYALGGNGDLTCLDAKTGKSLWHKNILSEFGGKNIQWGISESVLIDGDKLICTPGGENGTIVALNKKSGKTLWRSVVPGKSQAGYSSAIIAEVGGVRQYIQFLHKGLVGVRAENGDVLWGNDDSANDVANCSSPLFFENMVFSASGYGKGGAMVRLAARGKKVEATWVYHTNKMESHHGGLVLLDGHVYGSSDPGVLRCLEMATGNVKWENRSVGKGSITCADGYLYVRSEQGPVALVEATPNGYNEVGRFNQPQRSGASAWAHPVVAQGKLFLRDQDLLLAYDVKGQ